MGINMADDKDQPTKAPSDQFGWAHTYATGGVYEKIKPLARQMRHEPTPAEQVLWKRIRKNQVAGYKFRRQHMIDRFIGDFFCPQARLIIEVDGAIHDYTVEEDAARQEFLESLGLRVLRFSNADVLQNIEGVLKVIGEVLHNPIPTPNPSPTHWGGESDTDATD